MRERLWIGLRLGWQHKTPGRNRGDLTVESQTVVTRLLFRDGRRQVAVRYARFLSAFSSGVVSRLEQTPKPSALGRLHLKPAGNGRSTHPNF